MERMDLDESGVRGWSTTPPEFVCFIYLFYFETSRVLSSGGQGLAMPGLALRFPPRAALAEQGNVMWAKGCVNTRSEEHTSELQSR